MKLGDEGLRPSTQFPVILHTCKAQSQRSHENGLKVNEQARECGVEKGSGRCESLLIPISLFTHFQSTSCVRNWTLQGF